MWDLLPCNGDAAWRVSTERHAFNDHEFGTCKYNSWIELCAVLSGELRVCGRLSHPVAALVTWSQVPLNAIVCMTLIYVGDLPQNVVFALIMGWLMLGLVTLKALRKAPAAPAVGATPASS